MYAEMGLQLPCLQDSPQELHPLQEELLCLLQADDDGPFLVDNAWRDLVQNTTMSDYDLDASDLFKAPEPIVEEPVIELDTVTTSLYMMSSDDDTVTAEAIKVADVDPIQSEQLPREVLYGCNDPLAGCVSGDTFSELSDAKITALQIEEEKTIQNDEVVRDGLMPRNVSPGCLMPGERISGNSVRPNFLDFQGMDPGSVYGIRRTYSEGDIQILGNGSMFHVSPVTVYPPFDQKIEERRRKITRYRKKKTRRNFSREVKYACRKALADSQPRVRGRFARVEECEASK